MIAWVARASSQKYHAQPTYVQGIRFASGAEARYYKELLLLQKAGEISDLQLQPRFPIIINEIKICTYVADFLHREKSGRWVITEVKGYQTPVFKLKQKLFAACYPDRLLLIIKRERQ